MSKWVQFSFNCFWTPCVEKKTTEWQLLIQNANLWHGTGKMARHRQRAGVCCLALQQEARHVSLHSATSCICFWNLPEGDSKHDSTECLAAEGLASPHPHRPQLSVRQTLWGRTKKKLESCICFEILCSLMSWALAGKWLDSNHFVWMKFRI